MQPPEFKFNFKLSDAVHYAVGPSGFYTSATPYDIAHLPDGWKEIELSTDRDRETWGLITETSTTFKFALDAATILRRIAYTEGAAGRCTLDIYQRGHTQYTYSLMYTGEVDFSSFSDQDDFVSVNIDQAGISQTILRDQDKTIEVQLDPADSRTVILDGVALRNRSMLRLISPLSTGSLPTRVSRPPVGIVRNESEIGISVVEDTTYRIVGVAEIEGIYIFQPVIAGNLELLWDATIITNQSGANGVRFGVWASVQRNGATVSRTLLFETYQDGNNLVYNSAGVQNIAVQAGDGLSIYGASIELVNGVLTPTDTYSVGVYWKKGIYTLTYNTRQAATLTKAYTYVQLLRKFLNKLTDGVATLAPCIFDDPGATLQDLRPYHLCIAPAEAVRGITNGNYKLKFSDFVKDLSAKGLAFSISGNTLYLKRKAEYFQNVAIVGGDLGDIDTVEITQALPYLFSGVKVGAKAGDNDALQGRYEINAPMEYKITPSKSDGDMDYTSPFISGMYAIEQIRSQRLEATTNRPDDSRVILLETDATPILGLYPLYRPQNEPNAVISGLLDAQAGTTAFNLTLSPARDLYRNKPQISVNFMPPLLPRTMTFLSADREGWMMSKFGSGQLIAERAYAAAINFLSADPPFLPYLARFVAPEPLTLYAALQANPFGYLTFRYKNVQYKGFIHELVRHPGPDPGDAANMECQLLLHSSTDLTKLF